MYYCGIDVAMKSSYIFITDEKGSKKLSGEMPTTHDSFENSIRPFLADSIKVVIEAGNQTRWIYKSFCAIGADVTVVNPAMVKPIATSRKKTDKIDAKTLCKMLRGGMLPEAVHMPSQSAAALRDLLQARKQLVQTRTKVCNTVRGMLRQEGFFLPRGYLTTFTGWQELLSAENLPVHLKPIVEANYPAFESLTRGKQQLDRELNKREKADDRCKRLRTIPKVGRLTALTFVAAVDDIQRFSSSRKLSSYSGLCPTVRASGDRVEYGSINRQGRRELRTIFVQIAHLIVIDKNRSTARLRHWYSKAARRRGKKTAIVALARKLITIAFRLLKDGTDYKSSRVSRLAA